MKSHRTWEVGDMESHWTWEVGDTKSHRTWEVGDMKSHKTWEVVDTESQWTLGLGHSFIEWDVDKIGFGSGSTASQPYNLRVIYFLLSFLLFSRKSRSAHLAP